MPLLKFRRILFSWQSSLFGTSTVKIAKVKKAIFGQLWFEFAVFFHFWSIQTVFRPCLYLKNSPQYLKATDMLQIKMRFYSKNAELPKNDFLIYLYWHEVFNFAYWKKNISKKNSAKFWYQKVSVTSRNSEDSLGRKVWRKGF